MAWSIEISWDPPMVFREIAPETANPVDDPTLPMLRLALFRISTLPVLPPNSPISFAKLVRV